SDYVLYLHWLGEVDRDLQERCTQHILQRQLPDGGWNIYFGGPSEINASVKAYFALKLAGYSADLPFMREARANILRLGGVPGEKQLHELYPLGTEHKDFRLPRDERTFTWRNLFLRGDDALKMLHRIPWKPFRRLALEEAERWMMERIGDGSDGLATVYPAMLNALIALHALGYPNSHPALAKAQKDFEGLFVNDPEDFRIQPCLSPVWDTAINIIA